MKRLLKLTFVLLLVALTGVLAVSADENPYGTFIGPNAILFRADDGSISIWMPDEDGHWYAALAQTADELDSLPSDLDSNMMVESNNGVSLYKLTDGGYQVNNGPDAEGKVHVIVFDANFNEVSHATYSVYAEVSED